METCRDCPNQYPWLGDSEGTGITGRDNYIYNSNDGNDGSDGADSEQQDELDNRK